MSNAKQVLLDLEKELSGEFLEVEAEVSGKKFLFKTLNDKEMSWVFKSVDLTDSSVEMGMKVRVPTMAVAIRSIDGVPIDDIFEDDWNELTDKEKMTLLSRDKSARQFFSANLLVDWLGNQPVSFIQELFKAWQDLENRQKEAQEEAKNS